MHTLFHTGWLFAVGMPLMIMALILQTLTLAGGDYRGVLVAGFVLALLADGCFVAAFIHGSRAARVASVIMMLPTLFVVADFVRRAAQSFS